MTDAAARLDRSAYAPVFTEDFTGPQLDEARWVAHYLPQWTTPDRSAARYELHPGWLRLRIDADQPAWRPEDGELRVSNLQTGTFSGPAGSDRGTHRHRPGLTVRTPQPPQRLFTPTAGLIEARLRAVADPAVMLAVWLIGFEEDGPEQAGEICLTELYGDRIGPGGSTVRLGIKAHGDRGLRDDMADVALGIDATGWHTYAAAWTAARTELYVDERLVRTLDQGIGYPQQLMIDLFEFPAAADRDPAAYPKHGDVAAVRGYAPR
ncbi:glycoside hydrolase family 16 protein [Geodermatophilus sp. YIM 151500]|uniref:glycoside hydrolase family 16 protein n=1 Tax=Geodermatophilus sp. YIM 151500 TaxID=2984531 RepID=UPI0021E37BBF|nr:glycoside hydrolase family 16 protein [Geodermatophilus sp. YIM 151500]MCV2488130.1 glycoside hydrolase family 16 protein [Geodermatophilus sp. YIM 151500]